MILTLRARGQYVGFILVWAWKEVTHIGDSSDSRAGLQNSGLDAFSAGWYHRVDKSPHAARPRWGLLGLIASMGFRGLEEGAPVHRRMVRGWSLLVLAFYCEAKGFALPQISTKDGGPHSSWT